LNKAVAVGLVAAGVILTGNKHKLWGRTLVRLSESVKKADYRAISEGNSQGNHGNRRKRHHENHQQSTQDRLNSPQIAAAATSDALFLSASLGCAASLTVPALTLAAVNN
jgi:hypothetical protein